MPYNNAVSFVCGGTVAPCSFVKLSAAADETILQAGAGDPVIGVVQEGMKRPPGLPGSDVAVAGEAGDTVLVFGLGDDCLVQAGAAITRGAYVKSDASGFAVAASATDEAAGVALQSAAGAGSKIRIQLIIRKA